MENARRTAHDPWYDLVYHCLSLVPVGPGDASNLFDPEYVRWVDAHAAHFDATSRTLPEDAPLLGSLYRATPHAHLLHGAVRLHRTVEDFLAQAARPFSACAWSTPAAKQQASVFSEHLPEQLVELFRVQLWTEATSGYLRLREAVIEPLLGNDALASAMEHAQRRFPGVVASRWVLVHPLRRHGRLLDAEGKPEIAVGVPDPDLDVSPWDVVLQGCHEWVLSRVLGRIPRRGVVVSTRSQGEGWEEHMRPEMVVVSIMCSAFDTAETGEQLRRWVDRVIPDVGVLRASLPWQVREQRADEDTVLFLSSGAQVAPDLRPLLQKLVSKLVRR